MTDRSATDPLSMFAEDRARARTAADPWAGLCALATVDGEGRPQVRTVVLRDLDGRLGVFTNASSPKWPAVSRGPVAIAVFLGTPNVQYRMHCTTQPIPPEILRAHWLLRPPVPQRMDWLYARHPQSSPIADRATLVAALAAVDVPEPLTAPDSARGVYLEPTRVERLDLAQPNGVHDRRAWDRRGAAWLETTLVP